MHDSDFNILDKNKFKSLLLSLFKFKNKMKNLNFL